MAFVPDTKKSRFVPDGEPDAKPGMFESMGLPKFLDTIHDATTGIGQGLTFGFGDELNAAVASPIEAAVGGKSVSDAYTSRSDQLRGEVNAARERSPIASTVGEVVGGVGLAPGAQAAARLAPQAMKNLPNAVKFAGLGAATGGAYGAGTANPGERIEGGVKGAAIGAPVGLAAPYVAGGVARTVNGVRNALSPQANVSADLGRAIMRDADTPQAISQRFAQAQAERPGVASLADVGGENVRGLVERVSQTPGAGRAQVIPRLTAKQQEQANRIGADLRSLTGTNRTALQATQEVMQGRARAAQPLYRQAYEEGAELPLSPELQRLTSADAVVKAMKEAATKGRDRAVTEGFGSFNPKVAFNETGDVVRFVTGRDGRTVYPDLRFWDYTKRALDDAASAAARLGKNDEAGVIRDLSRQLRGELDTLVPSYRAAREAWSGPSAYLDAIESGRGLLSNRVSAEEFAAEFTNLSQSERAAVREGAVSAIVSKMGNDSAKLGDVTRYLRSPEMRAKIAAIMPTREAAEKWARRLDYEVGASELTGQALRNSATARRLAEREDAQNLVGDLVMDALSSGASMSLFRRIAAAGPKWLRDTLRSRADNILGDVLTNPQRARDLQRTLDNIGNQGRPLGTAPRAAAALGGVSATTPQ